MPVIMDADRMSRTLTRIAHEIVERNRGVKGLALVGIRTRGVFLAKRLAKALHPRRRPGLDAGVGVFSWRGPRPQTVGVTSSGGCQVASRPML